MGFTASRYLRTTAANKVEDITKAAALADLLGGNEGAAVSDAASATAAAWIRAAGIHTWAGGAAATDSITVTGLVATDIVLVNLSIRGSGNPTSVIGVNDAGNDQIDLLMDQNGEDGVTKVDYLVLITGAAAQDDAVLADVADIRTQLNALITSLEGAGFLAA